jgi:hypothetical protein
MKSFIKNIKDRKSKTAELLFLLAACLMMVSLLSGCNTTQTIAAQFGAAPLPTAVARKLYGTCGYCDLNPNCQLCGAVQKYNRKLAGAPKNQRAQFPVAGTSYRSHANAMYNPYGYQTPAGYQNTPPRNQQLYANSPYYPSLNALGY